MSCGFRTNQVDIDFDDILDICNNDSGGRVPVTNEDELAAVNAIKEEIMRSATEFEKMYKTEAQEQHKAADRNQLTSTFDFGEGCSTNQTFQPEFDYNQPNQDIKSNQNIFHYDQSQHQQIVPAQVKNEGMKISRSREDENDSGPIYLNLPYLMSNTEMVPNPAFQNQMYINPPLCNPPKKPSRKQKKPSHKYVPDQRTEFVNLKALFFPEGQVPVRQSNNYGVNVQQPYVNTTQNVMYVEEKKVPEQSNEFLNYVVSEKEYQPVPATTEPQYAIETANPMYILQADQPAMYQNIGVEVQEPPPTVICRSPVATTAVKPNIVQPENDLVQMLKDIDSKDIKIPTLTTSQSTNRCRKQKIEKKTYAFENEQEFDPDYNEEGNKINKEIVQLDVSNIQEYNIGIIKRNRSKRLMGNKNEDSIDSKGEHTKLDLDISNGETATKSNNGTPIRDPLCKTTRILQEPKDSDDSNFDGFSSSDDTDVKKSLKCLTCGKMFKTHRSQVIHQRRCYLENQSKIADCKNKKIMSNGRKSKENIPVCPNSPSGEESQSTSTVSPRLHKINTRSAAKKSQLLNSVKTTK